MEKGHKKLRVWQEAMELAKTVYRVTVELPSEEKYGLTSQMRRAAVSVPSNIAEGAAR
jgi:four helix bundle protein